MKKNAWEKITGIVFAVFLCIFSAAGILIPDQKVSQTERRRLAGLPVLSAATVQDKSYMEDMETYLLEQFAGRDGLRSLKAEMETKVLRKLDSGGYYCAENAICKLEPELNEKNIIRAASGFYRISQTYFGNAKIYVSIIPDKNYFAASQRGFPAMNYDKLNALVQENLPEASYIDLYGMLELSDYYRTDIHWKQDCITDVAEDILSGMGIETDREKVSAMGSTAWKKVEKTDSFSGGYAGASAFLTEPDVLNYLTNDTVEKAKVYDFEKETMVPVYDLEEKKIKDFYDLFLWGPRALLTVTNQEQKNGKKLMLFRDSFGSSLAPLLLEGYSEIALVDIRYVTAEYAMGKLDTEGYDDVLFLFSSAIFNHSESLRL